MNSGNIWSYDPFQPSRIYRFRLQSTGEAIRGRYIGEKTKGKPVEPSDREYEFEVGDVPRVFKSTEIVDPQFVGI